MPNSDYFLKYFFIRIALGADEQNVGLIVNV